MKKQGKGERGSFQRASSGHEKELEKRQRTEMGWEHWVPLKGPEPSEEAEVLSAPVGQW